MPKQKSDNGILSIIESAKIIGISLTTARKLFDEGRFKDSFRILNERRVPAPSLLSFMQENNIPIPPRLNTLVQQYKDNYIQLETKERASNVPPLSSGNSHQSTTKPTAGNPPMNRYNQNGQTFEAHVLRLIDEHASSFMETKLVKTFRLLDPDPGDIHIEDIARSLSVIPRFNGHTDYPWYVGAHSVMANDLAIKAYPGITIDQQLAVLLHDAPEAYLHDIMNPLKQYFGAMYSVIENTMMEAIHEAFDIVIGDMIATQEMIHNIDKALLIHEAEVLMPSKGEDWQILDQLKTDEQRSEVLRIKQLIPTLQVKVKEVHWAEVRNVFLVRFHRYA